MRKIVMGIPEMKEFWDSLCSKVTNGIANKNELKLYKKLGKTFRQIANDPFYPALQTHEIEELSRRYGKRVWQSYLENNTPAAGRVYWSYGPARDEITITGVEPHPNTKSNSYIKIRLSKMNGDEL